MICPVAGLFATNPGGRQQTAGAQSRVGRLMNELPKPDVEAGE